MDPNKLSLVIAFAALLLSALSPLLSAMISGHYRKKEIKLENEQKLKENNQKFYTEHRAEVIEHFISKSGQVLKNSSDNAVSEFGATMGEIYLYVDESLWPLIDSISDCIHRRNVGDAEEDFRKLCKALASENVRSKNDK